MDRTDSIPTGGARYFKPSIPSIPSQPSDSQNGDTIQISFVAQCSDSGRQESYMGILKRQREISQQSHQSDSASPKSDMDESGKPHNSNQVEQRKCRGILDESNYSSNNVAKTLSSSEDETFLITGNAVVKEIDLTREQLEHNISITHRLYSLLCNEEMIEAEKTYQANDKFWKVVDSHINSKSVCSPHTLIKFLEAYFDKKISKEVDGNDIAKLDDYLTQHCQIGFVKMRDLYQCYLSEISEYPNLRKFSDNKKINNNMGEKFETVISILKNFIPFMDRCGDTKNKIELRKTVNTLLDYKEFIDFLRLSKAATITILIVYPDLIFQKHGRDYFFNDLDFMTVAYLMSPQKKKFIKQLPQELISPEQLSALTKKDFHIGMKTIYNKLVKDTLRNCIHLKLGLRYHNNNLLQLLNDDLSNLFENCKSWDLEYKKRDYYFFKARSDNYALIFFRLINPAIWIFLQKYSENYDIRYDRRRDYIDCLMCTETYDSEFSDRENEIHFHVIKSQSKF